MINHLASQTIRKEKKTKLLLVCSSGGHFYQLFSLRDFWKEYARCWVTFKKDDTIFRLTNERIYWAHEPTNRNLKNLIRNLFLAWKVIAREKPDLIISTGAGVAVPFIYVGRLFRCKTIYIESLTRIHQMSLTGMMVYPLVDDFLVQWREMSRKYNRARFAGRVL